jgi:hypothetical protein
MKLNCDMKVHIGHLWGFKGGSNNDNWSNSKEL